MDRATRKHKRDEVLRAFDPDHNGLEYKGVFGLPFSHLESELVLLPVPWEVTVSYREGTVHGPEAILNASLQLDLFDPVAGDAWKKGIAYYPMKRVSNFIDLSNEYRAKAKYILDHVEGTRVMDGNILRELYDEIRDASEMLNTWVKETSLELMEEGKKIGLVGGDHSTPYGFIDALSTRYEEFGILLIDAHADLREAYEGFKFSHASIFYNSLQLDAVKKFVPVGIRDYSIGENEVINQNKKIKAFPDILLRNRLFEGESWKNLIGEIVSQLPDKVYISFDIDGLTPDLCPNTGTPVPGGLGFSEAAALIGEVRNQGKEIIGFDLSEVSPGKNPNEKEDSWDAIVGARVLFRLCQEMLRD